MFHTQYTDTIWLVNFREDAFRNVIDITWNVQKSVSGDWSSSDLASILFVLMMEKYLPKMGTCLLDECASMHATSLDLTQNISRSGIAVVAGRDTIISLTRWVFTFYEIQLISKMKVFKIFSSFTFNKMLLVSVNFDWSVSTYYYQALGRI